LLVPSTISSQMGGGLVFLALLTLGSRKVTKRSVKMMSLLSQEDRIPKRVRCVAIWWGAAVEEVELKWDGGDGD